MESWSFLSDENGLASSSAVESPSNSIISRSAFMNCPTTSSTFSRRLSVSGQQPLDMVRTFGEVGVPQRRPPFDSDQSVESNSGHSSSLVDLKLGRFGYAMNPGPLQEQRILSSSEKRVRPSTMKNTQTAYCQVYGCNKDLSSSKSYHKRHRVCDLHSKTATVIVKGIQQRFCQQCSRFHLIAEFDEGKRSCRKRLAGHNERRRKPLPPARSEGLLQSYIGNGFRGNTFMPTSFICPDTQTSSLNLKRYATADAYKQVKIEYQTSTNECGPLTPILIPTDQIHSETPVSGYTLFDKHLPFYQDSFTSSSLGGEDYFPVSTTAIHGQLGTSEHGRALSLLSSRSQNLNSSTQTSGFSMAETLLGMAEPEPISSSSSEDHNYDQTGANDLMKFERLVNRKEDRANTISLSQLSSRLQRVETQRQQSLQS